MKVRRSSGRILSTLLMLLLGSISVAPERKPKPMHALKNWQRICILKAKQEGSLVIYTIWDVEHIRSILDTFNKHFPGLNPTYWQGTRSEIITRTMSEYQGDQKAADVILSEGAPVVLRAAGAIEPYNTVQASSLILHDPTLPTVSLQILALSYNTKKIKKEELPKTWEDVANPKYKGMVALDDPMRAGPLSGLLAGLKDYWKDDARWTNFVRG